MILHNIMYEDILLLWCTNEVVNITISGDMILRI